MTQGNDRPIFVVGCPRSGTTMLQLMLHAHPRIAIPPENRFVLPAYHQRHTFGDLTDPERRRALGRWIVGERCFGDLGLDPDDVVERIVAAPPTLGSALGTVLQAYADRFGKPRWGDKRPAYLKHLKVIFRLFPDAQIINIVRDGRDCVASLKEAPWRKRTITELIEFWTQSAEATARAARNLRSDVYHQVRYEDLVRDPESRLRDICAFLGEEYDSAMTKPSEVAPTAVPEYKTWHTLTHADVTNQRIGSWRHRLTAEEVALCEAAFGDRLIQFGYEPAGPRWPLWRRHAWRATHDQIRTTARAVRRMRTTQRPATGAPVAARLTSGQRERAGLGAG
ncbi:sulfotransferase family protein [Couchioplanes caeruleus]|uniref:Sulfotransferase n=2 Tax=Couchioplanes caeruleus TaxID=56438 RepID=A0A1K0GTN9_9ACTN|nr:sulfotransferase [Couchioplanes caeruleus]OJF12643.1 sulfotransferase [Couchioplanes caeruleus subsp. caeruleus]ROP28431.1 sulfotransferase family protein [Couchioplanes caeruleus]